VLEAAHIGSARLLVIASPDSYAARRVVDLARKHRPELDIVVRTHSDVDREHFEKQGVGRVVMGEREMAMGMTEYALASLTRAT
jgi:CPA2 family monovalent cation:H+ antiporter-2